MFNHPSARVFILGLFALLFAACTATPTPAPTPTEIYGINPYAPPKAVNTFTLTDQDNQPFDLSALKGKWVLLAFGFTHCPDVCPDTMIRFKQIKTALKKNADKLDFMLISVDSARDTPDVMKSYLANFDVNFIGLSGDEATLRTIVSDFNATFRINPPDANGNYAVDHTAASFLLNPEGQLAVIYSYGVDYNAMLADLQTRVGIVR